MNRGDELGGTNEKHRLLEALEALREEELKNRDQYCKPVIAKQDHVRHYFEAYREYLHTAGDQGVVDQTFVGARTRSLDNLPIHRDTMGSLMGMVGELTAFVRSSLRDHDEELTVLQKENEELKVELEECRAELRSVKRMP